MRSNQRPRPGRSREPRQRGRPRLSRDVRGTEPLANGEPGRPARFGPSDAPHLVDITQRPGEGYVPRITRAPSVAQNCVEATEASRRSVPAGRDPRVRRRLGSRTGRGARPGAGGRGAAGEDPPSGARSGGGQNGTEAAWGGRRTRSSRRGESVPIGVAEKGLRGGLEWRADRYGVVRRPTAWRRSPAVVGRGRRR